MLIKGMQQEKKAYGTWPSPISKELLAGDTITLQDVVVKVASHVSYVEGKVTNEVLQETTGQIFHLENRPSEGGRGFIVEHTKDRPRDVLPEGHEYNVRSSVDGYGGAAFIVHPQSGAVIFTDSVTSGVYIVDPATHHVTTIAAGQEGISYAGFDVNPKKEWLMLAIKERIADSETSNSLVVFNSRSNTIQTIAGGADFYSNVHWRPDGNAICWTEWSLRDMPWTGTELFLSLTGELDSEIVLEKPVHLAGHSREESISQPRWGPDGSLFFASDRSGYWKLYQVLPDMTEAVELKFDGWDEGEKAEFSSPEWLLGLYI